MPHIYERPLPSPSLVQSSALQPTPQLLSLLSEQGRCTEKWHCPRQRLERSDKWKTHSHSDRKGGEEGTELLQVSAGAAASSLTLALATYWPKQLSTRILPTVYSKQRRELIYHRLLINLTEIITYGLIIFIAIILQSQ